MTIGVAIAFLGAVDHYLGVLAAALDHPAEARGHLQRAVAAHERLGAVPWTLRSRYQLARVQLDLGEPAGELLAAGDAGRAVLRLGADQLLDGRARRELRARLAELAGELDEAERWADLERAARVAAERDALVHELAAATGLGGRGRLLGDQSERARKAVTARIRDVTARIERLHPALGAHLRASVTTGTFCAYTPAGPATWEL